MIRMMGKSKNKNKKKFAQKMIPVAILSIVFYTVAALVLQFVCQVEVSPTLTGCWYGFWTVEIFTLGQITKEKVKNKYYEDANVIINSDVDEEDIDSIDEESVG